MKAIEKKEQYIILRGEGKSIRTACKELKISTSAGQEWEKALKERIEAQKADRLNELHEAYGLLKEKRIERLGNTLNKITQAIGEVDLSKIPADKLLDMQLKYAEALKAEYTPQRAKIEASSPKEALVKVLLDTAEGVRSGELTPEQAKNETQAVANLLKAYEQFSIEAKEDSAKKLQITFVDAEYKKAYVDEKTGTQYYTRLDREYEDRDAWKAGREARDGQTQKQYINNTNGGTV